MRKSVIIISGFFATLSYGNYNHVDLLDAPGILRQVAQDASTSLKIASESGIVYDKESMDYFTSIEKLMQIFADKHLNDPGPNDQGLVDLNSERIKIAMGNPCAV